jgi:hypothetical protein
LNRGLPVCRGAPVTPVHGGISVLLTASLSDVALSA